VLIKSPPHSPRGQRGLKFARDLSADVLLLQDGVLFTLGGHLEGFCGTAYALREDMQMRGLKPLKDLKLLDWAETVELLAQEEKAMGAF